MAMLAEPKRKQKYSVNPRGTDWSNDESKFGHKLMEKMGWSKGKGLGANEDGTIENVGIKMKIDNKGVGCKSKFADKWIEHQDDFNDLLQSLNKEQNNSDVNMKTDKIKVASLEKKSQKSRSRVHYMKFTKGKDLSTRSTEDLDCIFGSKKHKKNKREIVEEIMEEEKEKTLSKEMAIDDHGVKTFTNTCSIQEYFALKMKQKQQTVTDASDSSNQSAPSSDNITERSEIPINTTKSDWLITTKRRKRVSFNLEYHCFEEETDTSRKEHKICDDEPVKRKSKKKKKEKELTEDENVFEDSFDDSVNVEKSFKEDEVSYIPKKKKKKLNFMDFEEDPEIMKDIPKTDLVKTSEEFPKTKKSKKKKKKSKKIEENSVSEEHLTECEEAPVMKQKARKSKQNEDLETEEEYKVCKKKSKKKKKLLMSRGDESPKRAKKSKKKQNSIQMDCENENSLEFTCPEVNSNENAEQTASKCISKESNLKSDTSPIVARTEYFPIDASKWKHCESLSSEQVEKICTSFKGSNIHAIVGYLNSGLVAMDTNR